MEDLGCTCPCCGVHTSQSYLEDFGSVHSDDCTVHQSENQEEFVSDLPF